MKSIDITIGGDPVGWGYTWGYPHGDGKKLYRIPIYKVFVKEKTATTAARAFDAYRFGVQQKLGAIPHVVGLADAQSYVVQGWIENYPPHDTHAAVERGAWHIKDNYLIHDGPDEPQSTESHVFATIGCISICGPNMFTEFCDYLVSISGATGADRAKKLASLGGAKIVSVNFLKAERPTLDPV